MTGTSPTLVKRDRNHPAVLRWSQSNETEVASSTNPARAPSSTRLCTDGHGADNTRPISTDAAVDPGQSDLRTTTTPCSATTSGNSAPSSRYPAAEHLLRAGHRRHHTAVGVGEFVWFERPHPSRARWFATASMADARDRARPTSGPYTLLDVWSSFIPGVERTHDAHRAGYPTGRHQRPIYGEDNLPNPWSNPILVRIQRAMNPVAVADVAYWNANRMSNSNGDWPAAIRASPAARAFRARSSSSTTPSASRAIDSVVGDASGARRRHDRRARDRCGSPSLSVSTRPSRVGVTAPATGTTAVLVLQSSKDGREHLPR